MTTTIRIEGEAYLSLEVISDCYECEVAWLREVYDTGVLGGGRHHEGTLVLRAVVLDRVADVVRLVRYQGLAVEEAAALLGAFDDEWLR